MSVNIICWTKYCDDNGFKQHGIILTPCLTLCLHLACFCYDGVVQ